MSTQDSAFALDCSQEHDDGHWVDMVRYHPTLKELYISAPRSYSAGNALPSPSTKAMDYFIEERIYAKVGEGDWRVRRIPLSDPIHTYTTDPFGSDLWSAYGWTTWDAFLDEVTLTDGEYEAKLKRRSRLRRRLEVASAVVSGKALVSEIASTYIPVSITDHKVARIMQKEENASAHRRRMLQLPLIEDIKAFHQC